ncbi:MAG TPA: FtsX-like permease family protein [Parafilimonas sp.]|nr:FtsX-like permease family protein [Parafilimonas sp.]
MIKNYLTIALRTLWKNKVFSVINILGLAIGISASLVIYLLADYHFSFDKFEKDRDRIYRVTSNFIFSGEEYKNSGVTSPMPAAIKKDLTGFDAIVPFRTADDMKISVPSSNQKEPQVLKKQGDIVFAEESLFNLLGYEWIAGAAKTAVTKPYQTVLTLSAAALYFPKLKPSGIIGKELYFNDTIRTNVTGIVKDFSENTDFTFKIFISRATLEQTSSKPRDWNEWGSTTSASQLLVKLSPGNTVQQAEKAIDRLYAKYKPNDPDDKSKTAYRLQALSDIHFNGDYNTFGKPQANKPTLYGLLAIAAFLLLLGCINFINLTTAQAAQRAKEIGIRKTMGSSRRQLIVQFLSETFLLTLVATILSVMLIPLILKAFSGFIPDDLHFSLTKQPTIILFLAVLTIVVTLLSGFYPALVLSGFKPILVLKNIAYSGTATTRGAWLRRSLTVSQFMIAQVFVMGAILVSKQITYSINKDQGFKKEAILYFNTNFYDTVKGRKYVLLDKIRHIPEVAMVSLCNNPPSSNSTWSSTMKYKDGKKEIETDVQQKFGDTNYIKLYGLKLLAGTNITQSDTVNAFIINETYAHILGFQKPRDAVGKYLAYDKQQFPIRGVVADFNQHSLHEPIKPLVIASRGNDTRNISIALHPQNEAGTTWKTAIKKIEKAWKEIYPEDEFSYSFFDEDIAKYYDAEQHISSLLKWATGLAVFISCLGLLGLVIYTTNQRTKEIGVRKVLGASVTQIVTMISGDFIRLVLLAFIIAAPLAWIGMYKWLENFAFRTHISWWIFISGGAVMVLIALITLSFQTIKAAMANPVKSLRTE